MNPVRKLELTWIGKECRVQLEPRVLVEEPARSFHASMMVNPSDRFDNLLIYGDNLLALKALEQQYSGQIKCIYIDPPYNTGAAFTHYDDGLEHSLWLSMLRDRLLLLRNLLREDGAIFVQVDDNEGHYAKVVMDEVFGRNNFVNTIVWQKRISPDSDSKFLSATHDYIHVYSRDAEKCVVNRLPRTAEQDARYDNPDNDPRGPWTSSDLTRREYRKHDFYPITLPSGREVLPAKGRSWSVPRESFTKLVEDHRIYFGSDGNSMPRRKRFLTEVRDGVVPTTWWSGEDFGKNEEGKREVKAIFPDDDDPFATPKPERLLRSIIEIASNPGDLILDSFAGSGTTGAVAHKMGRRWIMVELGEHCHTHIIPRMKKVIDGTDQGGISRTVNWKGGGGFRYYRLGPSLIVQDEWGNPIINPEFNAGMLAEAMCKLEGFRFEPSPEVYWQQGRSSETDFLYVTTQMMTREILTKISDEVGPNRSLLICCGAFRCDVSQFENLTVKKIPKAVLKKCEWGHDDYSLEIRNLPAPPPSEEPPAESEGEPAPRAARKPRRRFGKSKDTGPSLFDARPAGRPEER